jgi:hypothetical protein
VQNLSNSLVVRGPDHFFNTNIVAGFPRVMIAEASRKRAVRSNVNACFWTKRLFCLFLRRETLFAILKYGFPVAIIDKRH